MKLQQASAGSFPTAGLLQMAICPWCNDISWPNLPFALVDAMRCVTGTPEPKSKVVLLPNEKMTFWKGGEGSDSWCERPLQNSVEELYSTVRFLRRRPQKRG